MRDEACAGQRGATRISSRGSARQRARVVLPTMTVWQPQEGRGLRGAAPASARQRTLGQSHVLQDHAVHVYVDGEGSLVRVEDARLVERLHDS